MKTLLKIVLMVTLSAGWLAAQLATSHAPTSAAPTAVSAATPAAAQTLPNLNQAVVKVNGVALTERDVREQMQRLFPYYSIHGGRVPEKYQGEIRQKAINQVVEEELIYQEAKRRGMVVPQATMQKVFASAKARFSSPQEYQQYGKQVYGSVNEFERRLRRATLIEQFEHQEIELKSKPTEAAVRDIYEKNKKSFLRPESAWLQSISVNLPENASDEQKKMARKRIDDILPQARAAKSYNEFGVLAERVSEDEYRINLGDHKWVHLVGLPAEITKTLESMQPGDISSVVEEPVGFTILRLNERRPAKQMAFEEVKDELRKQMEENAAQQKWASLQKQLKQNAHIETL